MWEGAQGGKYHYVPNSVCMKYMKFVHLKNFF